MDNFVKEFLAFNKLQFLSYDEKIVLYMLFSYGFLGAQEQLGMSNDEVKKFQEKSSEILNKLFEKARSQTDLETMGFDKANVSRWKEISKRMDAFAAAQREINKEGMTSVKLDQDIKEAVEKAVGANDEEAQELKEQLKWVGDNLTAYKL